MSDEEGIEDESVDEGQDSDSSVGMSESDDDAPTQKTWRSRGKGQGHGRVQGGGQSCKKGKTKVLPRKHTVHSLLEVDFKVPKTHPFQPLRPVGPHLPATIQVSSPAELFKLYFDSGIVERICNATNEYAERNKEKAVMYRYYTPMTPDDFYAFVGIFVHLGYRKIPRYRLMWSPTSLCYDPLVSKVFSRNKFESFVSFLHIVNEAEEKQLKEKGDKLCKVRPLNDHIQKRCKELYQPHHEISIDERMVRSKARFSFRQYIRSKPTKWGFKLWCLCDSRNWYTSSFSVYRGKCGEVRSSNGLGYDVVISLLQEYLSQGYSLYIDNFYTSPIL